MHNVCDKQKLITVGVNSSTLYSCTPKVDRLNSCLSALMMRKQLCIQTLILLSKTNNNKKQASKQTNKKASSQNPPVQERFLRMTVPQKVVLPCK